MYIYIRIPCDFPYVFHWFPIPIDVRLHVPCSQRDFVVSSSKVVENLQQQRVAAVEEEGIQFPKWAL